MTLKNYFFLFILPFLIFSCKPLEEKPIIQKGILDLQNYDFREDGVLELKGEWIFYWKKLYDYQGIQGIDTTDNFFAYLPKSWNGLEYKGESIPSYGYATYYLKIKLPRKKLKLAFKMPTTSSAYRLYINDKLVAKNGNVGTSKKTSSPEYLPLVADFENLEEEINIILQVSNFQQKEGGAWLGIKLGLESQIIQLRENSIIIEFFLLGSILIMGLYHLGLFWARRKSISALYFGLLCITIALRITTLGENFIHHPTFINWQTGLTIEYLTVSLSSLFFAWFFYVLFPKEVPKLLLYLLSIIFSIPSLIYLFFPPQIFTHILIISQISLIFGGGYFVIILIIATIRKRQGALILLIGFFIFFITMINDILFHLQIINTADWTPLGLFIFIFSQALLLSIRFSTAFQESEILTEKLDHINKNLENLVKERTQSLQESNERLSMTIQEVDLTNEKLNAQNILVEEKNRNITDSLDYASRIQRSILPSPEEIKSVFPESFILYQPLEIVSGDFYWFTKIYNWSGALEQVILAAVDCTGHGVPGAFMSMIGNNLLNEIVIKNNTTSPEKVLFHLHKGVQEVLKQKSTGNQDGMDMGLVTLDIPNQKLYFAGAKNPLIYLQNGEAQEIKADRFSIGGFYTKNIGTVSFTLHQLNTENLEAIYLFSDGYQDQFGGKSGRKFMLKNLKQLLAKISKEPMKNQEKLLKENLELWMEEGKEQQIDDILIMGFKF